MLIAHAAATSLNGISVQTPPRDTTGAKSLFIALGLYSGSGQPPVDSKGNVYAPLGNYTGSFGGIQIWYCATPIAGTNHTAGLSNLAVNFPAIAFAAFDDQIIFDAQNGARAASAGTSAQAGPVTPSQNDELIFAAAFSYNGNPDSIDSSFVPLDLINGTRQGLGIGFAYIKQGALATVNPIWAGTALQAAAIATFKTTAPPPPIGVSISLASGVASKGGLVSLDLSITSTGGAQCTAIEWTFGFTADLILQSVTLGAAAIAAGKTLNRAGPVCIVGGFNNNIIGDGVLVTAVFRVSLMPSVNLIPVALTEIAADLNADPIASTGIPGNVAVQSDFPLAPGLSLDPTTGVISGTPTQAGTFCVAYQVTDSLGATAQATCCIVVSPGLLLYVLNYRELDTASQIAAAAPIHTSLSGKLISTDHLRKWTRWNIPAVAGALMYREAGKTEPVFLFGENAYTLDASKLTDDDLGVIVPYYTTYFFVTHDLEGQLTYVDPKGQKTPLGSGRKLLAYLKVYIAAQPAQTPGTCKITITPFIDSLQNPWALVGVRTLTSAPKFDLEWGGGMTQGDRIALQFASSPITGTDNGFTLQRLTAFLKRAQRLQIRGAAQ